MNTKPRHRIPSTLVERQAAMDARDAQVCECGHKSLSHGWSDIGGIGTGQCGMDCQCKIAKYSA